jgi:hypothetical protein
MEVVESQTLERQKKSESYLICIFYSAIERVLPETQANRPLAGFGSKTLSFFCSYIIGKTLPARQREEDGHSDGVADRLFL